MKTFINQYHNDAIRQLKKLKKLADGAIEQITEEQLFKLPDEESNSIAIIMKHMSGNMKSRWTDFLTTDGDKNRRRDDEFLIDETDTKDELVKEWNDYWNLTIDTISNLSEEEFSKKVYIRKEPHLVVEAINRQLTHYAYHVGQIVFIAKHLAGSSFKSLSIPKGKSNEWEVAKNGKEYKTV